jgi:hypothetical protein
MSQPQQTAKLGEKDYLISPTDENEHRIAVAWIEKHYPSINTPGNPRFTTALPVDRLTPEHTVRVLARMGRKLTPALRTERNAQGESKVHRATDEELASELSLSAPVAVRKHWMSPADGQEGEIIVSSFLEELGNVCVPYCPKWKPEDGRKVRLAWA